MCRSYIEILTEVKAISLPKRHETRLKLDTLGLDAAEVVCEVGSYP